MKWNGLPIVIFGTSGHAEEILCIINDINRMNACNQYDFLGFVSATSDEVGNCIGNSVVVACDDSFDEYASKYRVLGVVLSFSSYEIKKKVEDKLSKINNIVYPNIISPYCHISDEGRVQYGYGNIIAAGCTLTCKIKFGNFNIVNRNTTIGHDCSIGSYCIINPNSAISGNVIIEDNVMIGAGVSIKQGVILEEKSIVGLGAFVVNDVCKEACMICEPAKQKK